MRPLIVVTSLILANALAAPAQTADNLILQGRAFLEARDITNANARFQAATLAAPEHQSANALYAASRLLAYPYTPAAQGMLDRLGFELTNRTIYGWSSSPPTDTNGFPVPPNDFSAQEAVTFLSTNILPEIKGAAANLAKIHDPNFVLSLSSNETKMAPVTVDYADVLMLRVLVHSTEFVLHYLGSLNVDAQLNALYAMKERNALSPRNLLQSFPALLDYARKAELPEARTAFQSAGLRYLEASERIRARPTNLVRLFNMDRGSADDEAAFRQTLAELIASLSTTTALTLPTNEFQNLRVNLGSFFLGALSPRGSLPRLSDDGILLGTLPDPTYGGSVFGLNEGMVYEAISETMDLPLLPAFDPDALPQLRVHVIDDREYALNISLDLRTWSESAVVRGTGGVALASPPLVAPGRSVFVRAEDLSLLARFAGRVVDGETGAGLAGATVGSSFDGTTTITDATGTFLLRTRQATESVEGFVLTASVAGYGLATLAGYHERDGNEVLGLEIRAYRPPRITREPEDVVARIGSSASFTVVAVATPTPTYRWRKGSTTVGGNHNTLSFAAVKASDAGEYSVTVTSAGGSVTSRVARLTVTSN